MAVAVVSAVFSDRTTFGAARLVLLALADRADGAGVTLCGTADVAERANVDQRWVRRLLQSLQASGHLVLRLRRGGRAMANVWQVTTGRTPEQADAEWAAHPLNRGAPAPVSGSGCAEKGGVQAPVLCEKGGRKGGVQAPVSGQKGGETGVPTPPEPEPLITYPPKAPPLEGGASFTRTTGDGGSTRGSGYVSRWYRRMNLPDASDLSNVQLVTPPDVVELCRLADEIAKRHRRIIHG